MAFHNYVPKSVPIPPALNRLQGLNPKFYPTPPPIQPPDLHAALPDFERRVQLSAQFGNVLGTYNRKIYVPNTSFQPKLASAKVEEILKRVRNAVESETWTPTKYRNLNTTQRNTFQLLKGRPDLKVVITDKNF